MNFLESCKLRPKGDSSQQLMNVYGNPIGPTYRADPAHRGWFLPDLNWQRENLVKIPIDQLPGFPLYDGTVRMTGITVHKIVAPALIEVWKEILRLGLTVKLRSFGGSFAPRHMLHDRSKPLSVHAFGAAIDVDVPWNGYGIPASQMQINRDVVKVFESFGFEWGGRWNPTDGMHFQWTQPLYGVKQPEWRDSKFGIAVPTKPVTSIDPGVKKLIVKARDKSGTIIEIPEKQFYYNNTLVTIDTQGNVVTLERRPT